MNRPASEAEYLARLVPPSAVAAGFSRRQLLRGALAAGAGVPLLAACGSGGSSGGGDGSASGTLTFGSNQSDPVPKKAYAQLVAGFEKGSDVKLKVNTVDHNTFQEQISNYLQGRPDDVFTWFAGYRMQFFAQKGLAGDVSDVWSKLDGMSDALKTASTASDGKQYFVPFDNYPWAIYYRPSVFKKYGYEEPKTLDDLVALSKQMQKDGLNPIAFGDKDGWPAMGTFDQLNMRVNGYQFHLDLMAGKESWASPQVKNVFDTWRSLLPYHQEASLGRTWQEAALSLQKKESGMYILGMFVGQQFPAAQQGDLSFFNFPEVDSNIGADAIEAPIDGFMMSKRPRNEAAAKDFLAFLGTPKAEGIYVKSDPTVIGVNSGADSSGYSSLQKKAVEYVGQAKNISQFMDRDTRPDFASNVMIPAIQSFIKTPADVDGLTNSIEKQKKSIFGSSS